MPHTIEITTAQNVTIDYVVANLGDRILAFIIDMLIKLAYGILLASLLLPQFSNSQFNIIFIVMFIMAIPIILYSLLFEIFNDGQTPGKRAMNIKVVGLNGQEVTLSAYFLRWLFRLIDINLLSGIIAVLSIAFSEKGQRIGDIIANTSVISLKKRNNIKQTVFHEIPKDYSPEFPAVINLKNEDITLIKEVLKNRSKESFTLKTRLADKIQEVLNISKKGSSEDFLKQVISDFNYFEQTE